MRETTETRTPGEGNSRGRDVATPIEWGGQRNTNTGTHRQDAIDTRKLGGHGVLQVTDTRTARAWMMTDTWRATRDSGGHSDM